jgi:hypothetical protein
MSRLFTSDLPPDPIGQHIYSRDVQKHEYRRPHYITLDKKKELQNSIEMLLVVESDPLLLSELRIHLMTLKDGLYDHNTGRYYFAPLAWDYIKQNFPRLEVAMRDMHMYCVPISKWRAGMTSIAHLLESSLPPHPWFVAPSQEVTVLWPIAYKMHSVALESKASYLLQVAEKIINDSAPPI